MSGIAWSPDLEQESLTLLAEREASQRRLDELVARVPGTGVPWPEVVEATAEVEAGGYHWKEHAAGALPAALGEISRLRTLVARLSARADDLDVEVAALRNEREFHRREAATLRAGGWTCRCPPFAGCTHAVDVPRCEACGAERRPMQRIWRVAVMRWRRTAESNRRAIGWALRRRGEGGAEPTATGARETATAATGPFRCWACFDTGEVQCFECPLGGGDPGCPACGGRQGRPCDCAAGKAQQTPEGEG
jgi:hypothetical protein